MTLAQHINIPEAKIVNSNLLRKTSQVVTALFKRLWWHTKAYTTVFGIMLLTFASLVFLYIHWSGGKLTLIFQNKTVVEQ
jgi:hypothetical protein